MKRYDMNWKWRNAVRADENGEWVRYEAAQAAIKVAVLAEREQIAQLCENYSVQNHLRRDGDFLGGRTSLAPFDASCMGTHAGTTFAEAIRARKS